MSEENEQKHGRIQVRRIGKRNILTILFLGTAGSGSLYTITWSTLLMPTM